MESSNCLDVVVFTATSFVLGRTPDSTQLVVSLPWPNLHGYVSNVALSNQPLDQTFPAKLTGSSLMKRSLPSVVSVVQNQCKSILNHCQSSFPRSSDNLLFELQRSSATDAAMVKIKSYGTMYRSHYGDGQVIMLQANLSHDNFPASSFLQAVCSHQYRFSDLALLLCPLLKISSCFPSPKDFPQLVWPSPA